LGNYAVVNKIDLAAIKARADAATPGPWKARTEYPQTVTSPTYGPDSSDEDAWVISTSLTHRPDADAEFIAHARTDVPALLAHVAELEAERDEARRTGARAALRLRDALRVADAADGWRRPHTTTVDRLGANSRLKAAVDAWRAVQPDQTATTEVIASVQRLHDQPDLLDAPADPAGLDAAIEAAARGVRELEAMTTDGYVEQRLEINAAVRAAAPYLRAAALNEAEHAHLCDDCRINVRALRARARRTGGGGDVRW
jgi:hypothetical protein